MGNLALIYCMQNTPNYPHFHLRKVIDMSTLTIGSIIWHIHSHEGKAAFVFSNSHAIMFHEGMYVIVSKGNTVYMNKSVSECLKASTDIILDSLAENIVPCWEM